MILNDDKCTSLPSGCSPLGQPTAKMLWGNAKGHNGFIGCGFLSIYGDPSAESPVAFPIGTDLYIEEFLRSRIKSIEILLRGLTQTANIASPSLPVRQAMNGLLRACITQKCGHLLWAFPPDNTTDFCANVDEELISATQDTFNLEEMGELQKDPLYSRLQGRVGLQLPRQH